MTNRIVFVHGMFQNPKSWENWINYFQPRGYECAAPAWPLHAGEPTQLRNNPPAGLGTLHLREVISSVESIVGDSKPILIGHSVGGLIAQILLNRGKLTAAVAIDSVAPNGMIDFDLSSLKNIAVIANPLKGDDPIEMDLKTFHGAFANTLDENTAATEFQRTATHDSRNVLRDCMKSDGKIDLKRAHAPLLLIGGEKDEIIPQHLTEKNARAYDDGDGIVTFKAFKGRSHYICNEPGWEEVAAYTTQWLDQQAVGVSLGGQATPTAEGVSRLI
jgi:pimeloyl-ACP methyl ester carboxylesterase